MFVSCFATTRNISKKKGDYQSIALAMQATNAGDTLLIRNGTYRGTGFHSIDWPYEKNLVLRAETDSLVTINCKGNAFLFFSQSTEQANKVRGLKIINANPAFTITKANPIIQDNILVSGRGLVIVNDPNNRVVIRGNTFRNMNAVLSQVGGCTFLQNNIFIRCSSKEDTCLLSVIHADSLLVKENLFVQNRLTLLVSDSVRTVLCNNNTITCNSSLPLWVKGSRCLRIKNNIFYKNQFPKSAYNKLLYTEENESCYKVAYNCFFGNTNDNLGKGPQFVRNKVSDPGLGTDYTPLWTSTAKSICIDNGDPDTDGDGTSWVTDVDDQDGDGTRKDIGAKKVPLYHYNYITTLQAGTAGGKNVYNWICFPYMDKLYNSGSPETNEYIFHTYHGNNLLVTQPSVLNTIQWNYNADAGTVNYGNGWNNTTNTVISQKGYKVCLLNGQSARSLESAGFHCGTTGNSNETINIDAKETGHAYREIWVGYFKEANVDALTALGSVANQLIEIKTKDWAYSRSSVLQTWSMPSGSHRFHKGEAVSLRYVGTSAINFTWTVPDTINNSPAYQEAAVQHFNYAEQADYTPFFVKVDSDKSITKNAQAELALYINGQCYGAEVVQGDTVQINGYINEIPDLEQATVEFRYWAGGEKAIEQKVDSYSVYNQEYQVYEKRPLEMDARKSFYVVSFDAKDNGSVPAVTTLETNYPNPFNPETTIKYSVAKAGKVNLSIYNIKGQLVRTLVNENQEPSYRSIVWKGENNNGSKVSSGVYFYRLQTAEKVMTKKMLLMK